MTGALKRRLYAGGRPGRLMRAWNRLDAILYRLPLLRRAHVGVLVVRGRSSGRLISLPVAVAELDGDLYLVSMLGPDAGWVRNVRAASGRARLHWHGRERDILLDDVPPAMRAPILRRYVAIAPGARPHIGLGPDAPLEELERRADRFPVFRVTAAPSRPQPRPAAPSRAQPPR